MSADSQAAETQKWFVAGITAVLWEPCWEFARVRLCVLFGVSDGFLSSPCCGRINGALPQEKCGKTGTPLTLRMGSFLFKGGGGQRG